MRAQHLQDQIQARRKANRAGTGTRVRLLLLGLLLVGIGGRLAVAARTPAYHLMKTTKVGGEGGWDYLTVDSQARPLYISRGDPFDVIDADTGAKMGEIANTPR